MARFLKAALAIVFLGIASASSQATTGAIVGMVTDASGGTIPGATVTAISVAGPRRSVVTKADGSYRIADLPPGAGRLQVVLQGFETAVIDANVKAGVDNKYDVVLTLGFHMGARPIGDLRPAPAEIEVLVRQSIEALWDLTKIPDGGLLQGSTRIAVQEEMPQSSLKLGSAALPQRAGYEFRLIAQAATQEEADSTKKPRYFLVADKPRIDGDAATIWIGVDVTFPREPKVGKLCCCVGHGQFAKQDNKWSFVKWLSTICA